MAFSFQYPKSGKSVRKVFGAYGQLGSSVVSVTGRVISYSPTAVQYASIMQCWGTKSWRLIFDKLTPGKSYDLEILDQDGELLHVSTDLKVISKAADIEILDPPDGGSVCTDFQASGTTTEELDDLRCIKLYPSKGDPIDGELVFRDGHDWMVQFLGIGDGDYTLKISHNEDCEEGGEAAVTVNSENCENEIPFP